MSPNPDLPDLIDRLSAAAVEVKSLLSDLHTERKTLRADLKEAREMLVKLRDAIPEIVNEEILRVLEVQLPMMTEAVQDKVNTQTEKIVKEFERLTVLIYNSPDGSDWRDSIDGGEGRIV